MVKLKSCISLCPLTDQKNFLGLSEDSQPESLIVTLGKNMVLRTKTTDLQQLTSWNIRDQLTGPVVYDAYEKRYVGVFNNSFIKFWNENEQDYDKAKKYKFVSKLHCILTHKETECLIVFSNGNVQSFSQAIHGRKQESLAIIQSEESIVDVKLCNNFVALFVTNDQSQTCSKLYLVFLNEHTKPVQIELKYESKQLISHCVVSNETETSLITLWSDGNIHSSPILLQASDFPGQILMNIKTINTQQPVAMENVNSNLLVLYGCDPGEEGALLLIVDTRLRSVVCRHYFKMYTKPPRLWVFRNNILLSMGQYLALVPFQMTSQLLDTKIMTQIPDQPLTKTVNWENTEEETKLVSFESYESKFSPFFGENKNEVQKLISTLDQCAEVPDDCLLNCVGVVLAQKSIDKYEKLLLKILSFVAPKSGKFKNRFDFQSAVDFLVRILEIGCAVFDTHTCSWVTCIVDAYYQRFVLCDNPNIKEILKLLQSVVQLEVSTLLELSEIKPKLERKLQQLNKKDNDNLLFSSSKTYSYDIVKLY